ncbi:N-succinylarginine dihydrolase [Nibricoccus sp. IMCC34717]|uniref:N-succinylarginine dihydrolase n=1 Tax=Nibricoccus sp. IMCC34717 TaxID=3034021 RepID=UPI00384F7D5C
MKTTTEMNFDGLVGPTHNYAGLSFGNVASMTNRGQHARPREAALQGLAKMKALADLGLAQGFIPPQERPNVMLLRAFGYSGDDKQVISAAARSNPALLAAACSASAMWVANAATVTPSSDAADGRVHFTPANLISKLHRSQEAPQTARLLEAMFSDAKVFAHHPPVPGGQGLGDEGAANHNRLAPQAGARGLHVFVYGHRAFAPADQQTKLRFPSRQAREASEAVARAHGISESRQLFLGQSARAINAGVFHNDVISVANDNVLLYHDAAFEHNTRALASIRAAYEALNPGSVLHLVRVPQRRVSLVDAVRSYIFNSQLVTLADGTMALIAPEECREIRSVRDFLEELVGEAKTPIRRVMHFDLRQSMRNGGGPACLRLRVTLTARERERVAPGVVITAKTYPLLVDWVKRHYRETLAPADLADPELLDESRRALEDLTRIAGLGKIYPFQASVVRAPALSR